MKILSIILLLIIIIFIIAPFLSPQENNTQGFLILSCGYNTYGVKVNAVSSINYHKNSVFIDIDIDKNHRIKMVISEESVTVTLITDNSEFSQTYFLDNLFIGIAKTKNNTIKVNFLSDVTLYNNEGHSYIVHQDSHITIEGVQ